jgi:hypothetical protein
MAIDPVVAGCCWTADALFGFILFCGGNPCTGFCIEQYHVCSLTPAVMMGAMTPRQSIYAEERRFDGEGEQSRFDDNCNSDNGQSSEEEAGRTKVCTLCLVVVVVVEGGDEA